MESEFHRHHPYNHSNLHQCLSSVLLYFSLEEVEVPAQKVLEPLVIPLLLQNIYILYSQVPLSLHDLTSVVLPSDNLVHLVPLFDLPNVVFLLTICLFHHLNL